MKKSDFCRRHGKALSTVRCVSVNVLVWMEHARS
jgi:hypothetical protein